MVRIINQAYNFLTSPDMAKGQRFFSAPLLFFTMSHQLSIRLRLGLRLKKQVKAEVKKKQAKV